jgi:dTDP-4-dehydrorhamnose reductase
MKIKILIIGRKSFIANFLKKELSKFYNVTLKNFKEILHYKKINSVNFIINCSSSKPYKKNHYNQDRDIFFAKKIIKTKCKLIMLSTAKVYGDKTNILKKESSNCRPTSAYGKSRYLVEKKIQKLIPNQYLILRLSNLVNFDIRQKTGSRTAINCMLKDLRQKKIITIPNEKTIKDFVTMKFFLSVIISCLKKNLYGVYNLSSGFSTDLNTLSKLLIKGYGSGIIQKKKRYTDKFILDNSKLFNKIKKKMLRQTLYNEVIAIGKKLKKNV